MTVKESLVNKVFVVVFVTWVFSLLAVYFPISNWMTVTFPKTINNYILTFFIASTGLATFLSLYLFFNIMYHLYHFNICRIFLCASTVITDHHPNNNRCEWCQLLLYVVGDYGAKDDWTRVGTNPHLDTIAYNANYISINKVRLFIPLR